MLIVAVRPFSTKILVMFLIETAKKLSNVFGYQEPADLSTTGQYARHACNLTV